jgi:hypothetical protein
MYSVSTFCSEYAEGKEIRKEGILAAWPSDSLFHTSHLDQSKRGVIMGFGDWLKKQADGYSEASYFMKLGTEVLGPPRGMNGMGTPLERADRIRAGRKEHERRAQLGARASDAALGAAYREAKTQSGRDVQFESNGIKVLVKNGFSRNGNAYTTDIILIDPGRPGMHLHYVLDENGQEVHK